MKKEYQKPAVSFESFELNTSIAACAQQMINATNTGSCTRHGTQSDPKTGCKFYDGGWSLFLQATCDMYPVNNYIGNLCYHVPTDTGRMFIS